MKKIFAMLYDFVDANAVYIVGDTLLATEINLKKQLANQPILWKFQKPLLIT